MDDGGHRDKGGHRVDYYKGVHPQWNMMPQQYQVKDQNALLMNRKIMHIVSERDTAIEERDRALSEKKSALEERDMAIQQRDAAIADRNDAIRERDNAIAALRFQETTMNNHLQRGSKRTHHHHHNQHHPPPPSYRHDQNVTEAYPITVVPGESTKLKMTKERKSGGGGGGGSRLKKQKKVGEDLNRNVTTDGSKAEWDAQELGLMDQINFDESTMPIPICSCTGVGRQCYKWGSGGWQSSCCTTTISVYPLPQMPNKRHSRMGGRKMSGTVFTRLLSRLAAQGHDLSAPVDLKNYWAKHGTNRYITIK